MLSQVGLSGDGSAVTPPVDPTAEAAVQALSTLDGRSIDQLYFEGVTDDGRDYWGAVVGGQLGHVVLHIAIDDDTHYAVRDAEPLNHERSVVRSGGSDIDVMSRWVVPVERAARGLLYFLSTGTLDPRCAWDRLSTVDFRP